MRPGNPTVVHHTLLFQDTTRTARKRDSGSGYPCFGTPGFLPARGLGGWTPGSVPVRMPEDIPTLLHGGADLVLQVHYHPTGKPETDRTRLALYFTDRPPRRRMMDIPLGSNRIDIPAGERAYKVTDHFTVPVDVDVLAINPHAHYVCREMYGYAVLPGRHSADSDPHPRVEFRLAAALYVRRSGPSTGWYPHRDGVHLRQLGSEPAKSLPSAAQNRLGTRQYR